MKSVVGKKGPHHQSRRPDIARLWEILETEVVGDDDLLKRDFIHLKAGTPVAEAFDWFLLVNMELDGKEPPIVEVRVKGILRNRVRTYPGRVLTFRRGKASVDGEDKPELRGRTIVGVRWVSGRGHVETVMAPQAERLNEKRSFIKLQGMINGVRTDIVV